MDMRRRCDLACCVTGALSSVGRNSGSVIAVNAVLGFSPEVVVWFSFSLEGWAGSEESILVFLLLGDFAILAEEVRIAVALKRDQRGYRSDLLGLESNVARRGESS